VFPCKEKEDFLFFHAFLFALGLTQHIVLYAKRKLSLFKPYPTNVENRVSS